MEKCCICGKTIKGYGNNAEPVMSGRCCDDCNWHFVITRRLNDIQKKHNKHKKED